MAETDETEALAHIVVCDAGPLIHLDELDCLFLLTDDTAARLAANNLAIPVHGTLGILLRAIRRQQMTANEALDKLYSLPGKSTLHVKPALLEEVIQQVKRL